MLKGLMKCGYCGMSLTSETGTTKRKTVIYYYKCSGRKQFHNGCKKETFKKEVLEEIIINEITKQFSKPQLLSELVKEIIARQSKIIMKNTFLESLEKEKKANEKALSNLMSAIEQGIITSSTKKRLEEVEFKIKEIEEKILLEKINSTAILNESEIKKYYLDALKLEPKQLITIMIKQMIVFDDKIIIEFNTPIKESPDDQDFLFYDKMIQFTKTKKATINNEIEIIFKI